MSSAPEDPDAPRARDRRIKGGARDEPPPPTEPDAETPGEDAPPYEAPTGESSRPDAEGADDSGPSPGPALETAVAEEARPGPASDTGPKDSLYAQFAAFVTDRANQPKSLPAIFALLLVPIALGWLVASYVGGAHRVLDETFLTAEGSVDRVTAMAWSLASDGPLFVGTAGGTPLRIGRDGSIAGGEEAGAAPSPAGGEIVQIAVPPGGEGRPVLVVRERGGERPRLRLGAIEAEPGLAAVLGPEGGTVIAAPAEVPFDMKSQQSAPRPAPPPTEVTEGHLLFEWIAEQGQYVEVGRVFGIEDVRAVAALPGRSMAIAGDGAGGVFAIDASQQISGVSPTEYLARLGSHDAAITAIAAAANAPTDATGPDFLTAAADGTLKAWWIGQPQNGSFSVATTARSVDIATAGSKWTKMLTVAGYNWRSLEATSAEGNRIVVEAPDGHLVVVDVSRMDADGRSVNAAPNLDLPAELSAPVALSDDGAQIAAFNQGRDTVDIYSTGSGMLSRRIANVQPLLESMRFDPPGRTLALLSENGSFALVDIASGTRLPSPEISGLSPGSFAFSPDGSAIALGVDDSNLVEIVNIADGSRVTSISLPEKQSNSIIRFIGNGEVVIYNISIGNTYRYSIRSGRITTVTGFYRVDRIGGELSMDGSRLLIYEGEEGVVKQVDTWAEAGRTEAIGPGPNFDVNRDMSRLFRLEWSGDINVFDEQPDDTRPGSMPQLAEDGLRLSEDGSVLLFRDTAGRLYRAGLTGLEGEPARLAPVLPDIRAIGAELSPDGGSVVVAEADGTIDWIDLAGGTEVPILGHGDLVQAMAISSDGAYLASASLDGRLRITDLPRARRIAALPFAHLRSSPPPEKIAPRLLSAASNARVIAAVQRALVSAGYGPMPADGILGPATRRAISQWQAANGQTPTGEITDQLWQELFTVRPATTRPASNNLQAE